MSLVRRFAADLIDITDVMPLRQSLVWYGNIFRHLPQVVKTRKYYPADNDMTGMVNFRYCGTDLAFDLTGTPNQSFSWLREFFVRDNYFREFDMQRMIPFKNFVDLGCNVGRVSQIVKAICGGKTKVLAVDADDYTDNRFRRQIASETDIQFVQALVVSGSANENFDRAAYQRTVKKYGDTFNDNGRSITGNEILSFFEGENVDFMKLDIEGAEFDILFTNAEWLSKVDNLAMEVHPELGNPATIIEELRKLGYAVSWRANYEENVRQEASDFIYGSRNGMLKNPR